MKAPFGAFLLRGIPTPVNVALLQVLAQDERIAALCELDVLQKRHSQQNLPGAQPWRNTRGDIGHGNVANTDLVKTGDVGGSNAIGGLCGDLLTLWQ